MKKNTDIAYYPKPVPGVLKHYLTAVLNDAPCGRDGIFESDYAQEKLNEFPWESYNNLACPTLIDFSKWLMSRAKRGRGRNGQRKSPSKESLSPEIATRIIQDVEAVTDGKITDSFLGSVCYNRIHHNLEKKYGITIKKDLYAKVIISRRKVKRDCNQNLVKVYFYYPNPIQNPSVVKLGYTEGDPIERMKQATQNIASEEPKMGGWFNGTRKDEREAHEKFRTCRSEAYGNKEIYVLDEGSKVKKLCDYFEEKIAIQGGKKEKYWPNHVDIIFTGSAI